MNAELFLHAARDPDEWLRKSVALRHSGDALWYHFSRALSAALPALALGGPPPEVWGAVADWLVSAKLMYGLALETAFKAEIIRTDPSSLKLAATIGGDGQVTEVALKELGVDIKRGHGLADLAGKAGALTPGAERPFTSRADVRAFREILLDLEEVVRWSAKYPTPTHSAGGHEKPEGVPTSTYGHRLREWTDAALDHYQGSLWTPHPAFSALESHVRSLYEEAGAGRTRELSQMLRIDPRDLRRTDIPPLLDRPLQANSPHNRVGTVGRPSSAEDNLLPLLERAGALRLQAEKAARPAERVPLYHDALALVAAARVLTPQDAQVQTAALDLWASAVNAGNDALRNGHAEAAGALYEVGIEAAPDRPQAHFGLGLARYRAADATAVAPFERAAALDPSDPTLAVYYGRSLLRADRATEGISVFEDAERRFPYDADIRTEILNAYAAAGRTDEAIGRYEAAIAERYDDAVYRYNYGALLLQAERFDEAIEQLERATTLDPTNADALYNLGAAYQNKATDFNRQANETHDDAEANRLLEERDANIERALPYFERARALVAGEPSEADVCLALFQLYTRLGRTDDADRVAECAGSPAG